MKKDAKVEWAKNYLLQETVSKKLQSKSAKKCYYAELESKLFAWFTRLENSQAVVTDKLLREKALAIAAELKETEFKASQNWLLLFKQRHNIRQYVLQGEAGSADKVYVDIAKNELPSILRDTAREDIYNGDETGLLYRAIPDRTLATDTV